MAVSSPAENPSASETGRPGLGPPPAIEAGDRAILDLSLMRATIQDGILMVFGPDGDPVPPQIFRAAAEEQPHAQVRLSDGPGVQADRIAAVLAAQMSGRLGSEGGDQAWIRTMLGIGPRPEPATDDDLFAESRDVEVIAFGKEMMITSPAVGTFLIAEARATLSTGISVRGADDQPMALGDLVARLLGRTDRRDAHENRAETNEVTLPDCKTRIEDDALIIDLPEVGAVRLIRQDPTNPGPSVSVFKPDGDTATIDDLLGAQSRPLTSLKTPSTNREYAPPAMPGGSLGDDPDAAVGSGLPTSRPPRQVSLASHLSDALGSNMGQVALVLVNGLPHGACLSAGAASSDGSWLLSPQSLPGLTLTPPPGWTIDLALEIVSIAIRNWDGELTRTSKRILVPIQAARGTYFRAPIPIVVDPQVLSEPLDAIIVHGLPAEATLSAGVHDPAIDGWVLLPRQVPNLTVTPSASHTDDFAITLLGISLADGRARSRHLARIPVSIR